MVVQEIVGDGRVVRHSRLRDAMSHFFRFTVVRAGVRSVHIPFLGPRVSNWVLSRPITLSREHSAPLPHATTGLDLICSLSAPWDGPSFRRHFGQRAKKKQQSRRPRGPQACEGYMASKTTLSKCDSITGMKMLEQVRWSFRERLNSMQR